MLGVITRSILAGVAISIGGIANLHLGSIPGAVLFTIGLIAVVHYQWDLYTGKAGFWNSTWWRHLEYLLVVLLGNVMGCILTGTAISYAQPYLVPEALDIVSSRVVHDGVTLTILGAGCGFLMTTAVAFAKDNRYLPLLFAVPTFILSGFAHSIADAFYYSVALTIHTVNLDHLITWLWVVLGNFLGCNLWLLSKVK